MCLGNVNNGVPGENDLPLEPPGLSPDETAAVDAIPEAEVRTALKEVMSQLNHFTDRRCHLVRLVIKACACLLGFVWFASFPKACARPKGFSLVHRNAFRLKC
jgi:hypothetical protein